MRGWWKCPSGLACDARVAVLTPAALGLLLMLMDAADGTGVVVTGGAAADDVARALLRTDPVVAAGALGELVQVGLVEEYGARLVLSLPTGEGAALAEPPRDIDFDTPAPTPRPGADERALRKRVASMFRERGLATHEARLAWIQSDDGAGKLAARGVTLELARDVATSVSPVGRRPSGTLSVDGQATDRHGQADGQGADRLTDRHGQADGQGDGQAADRVAPPPAPPPREGNQKSPRETDTLSPDAGARGDGQARTGNGQADGQAADRVRGQGTDRVADRLTGQGPSPSMRSEELLGIAADEVVDLLQRRCGARVVTAFDTQQLAAFQRVLTDLAALGQLDRARLELFVDWINAGGFAWRTRSKADLRYLCGVGVLARHLADAQEWAQRGRGEIRRGRAAPEVAVDGPGVARDEAPAGESEADPWASVPDITAARLERERAARAARARGADAAREEVVHGG